jgi:hypothetical protein
VTTAVREHQEEIADEVLAVSVTENGARSDDGAQHFDDLDLTVSLRAVR